MNSASALISLVLASTSYGLSNLAPLHQLSAYQHNCWISLGIRVVSLQLIEASQHAINGDRLPAQRLNNASSTLMGTHASSVPTFIDYLEAGDRLDDFLDDFPTICCKQATSFLKLVVRHSHFDG
jgi:hypothetical protein